MTLSITRNVLPFVIAFTLIGLLSAGFANAQAATNCILRSDVTPAEAIELTGNPAATGGTGGSLLPIAVPPAASAQVAAENAMYCSYGLIKWVTRIFFVVVLAVAILLLAYASFLFVTAGQDPARATKARTVIIFAVVGLLVAAVAYIIPTFARGLLVT